MDNARMMERERERLQIEQDLTVAREIQQRLLPKGFKQYGFLDVSGLNQSCYSVGGDYFDVVELGAGRAAFVVADVSGKGLSAALLTAMLQGGFSGLTLTPDPTRLVNHFNQYVWTRSEPHHYATVFLCVMDDNGRAEFINAGHHSALLLRRTEVTAPFESECFPVGLFPEAEFRSRSAHLEPGDTLVMFTDGINEATDVHDEEFGMERLSEVVRSNAGQSAEVLQASILEAVTSFCRARPAGRRHDLAHRKVFREASVAVPAASVPLGSDPPPRPTAPLPHLCDDHPVAGTITRSPGRSPGRRTPTTLPCTRLRF